MKYAHKALRVACFLALPLFFQQQELTPQPIKNMLLAFMAAVISADLLYYFLRNTKRRIYNMFILPLLAVIATLLPYLSMVQYFEPKDQLLMVGTILLSLLYYLDKKYL
jgi:hypothetical protein